MWLRFKTFILQLWRQVRVSILDLWQMMRTIDLSDRRLYYFAGGAVLLLFLLAAGYRLLNPVVILETGDYHPFESVEEYDTFLESNPLLAASAPKGEGFTKSGSISDSKVAVYEIELSQRPLKPVMDTAYRESYMAYLEQSQDRAEDWIRSLGLNPDELTIIWNPNPATMRQKLLGDSIKPIPKKDGQSPSPAPSPTIATTPTPNDTPSSPPSGRFPQ